jgi:hypothetical protein
MNNYGRRCAPLIASIRASGYLDYSFFTIHCSLFIPNRVGADDYIGPPIDEQSGFFASFRKFTPLNR